MNANLTIDYRRAPIRYPVAIRTRTRKKAGWSIRPREKKERRASVPDDSMGWLEAAHLRACVGEWHPYDGAPGVWTEGGDTVRISGAWWVAIALVCVLLSALLASLCVLAAVDLAFFHGTLFGLTAGMTPADGAIPISVEVYDANPYAASLAGGAEYIGRMEWDAILPSDTSSMGWASGAAVELSLTLPGREDAATDAETAAGGVAAKDGTAGDTVAAPDGTGPAEAETMPGSAAVSASEAGTGGAADAGVPVAGASASDSVPAGRASGETSAGNRPMTNMFPLRTVSAMRGFLAQEKFIIHAGGFLSGTKQTDGWRHDYTNCREALENCYAQGNRVCELDFMETSDGYFICGHDGTTKWVYGLPYTKPQTRETFLAAPMFDEFSTMDLEYVAEFLREHIDFYIVTDVKDRNVAFCKTVKALYPDLMGRFLIQIYHEKEYNSVHDLGFPFIIFTLYMTTSEEHSLSALTEAIESHQFVGLTFFADWAKDANFMSSIRSLGIPLYVHTVNSRERQENMFAAGVTAVYTDEAENMAYR